MKKSALQIARAAYQPKLPAVLKGSVAVQAGEATESAADHDEIKSLFPITYGMPIVKFVEGEKKELAPINVGVILSGGQAPGGHNVISGLFDGIKRINPESRLFGFLMGPDGLINHKYMELTADIIDEYRNTGGFDIIGSGRTKLEKTEQFDKGLEILGVALDEKKDEELWKKMIVDRGMSWNHGSSLQGWDCPVAKTFNVTAIPRMYIIDKEGKIIAQDLRGEKLQEKMAELFK